jgi:hypothetical protein
MWVLVNTVNNAIIDIVDTATDKYNSIYEDLPLTIWIEYSGALSDFNRKHIPEWCYDSSKTTPFIKKSSVTITDINYSLEMNKNTAKILLAKTDWAVLEDVTLLINRQDFIYYRSTIRDCIINPREGRCSWPSLIEAQWSLPLTSNRTSPINMIINIKNLL